MEIKIYKGKKPKKGDSDYLIKFPSKTCVMSLEPTIQILFVLDKDTDNTRKILNVCKPWNYIKVVVFEGGLKKDYYCVFYNKIIYYQYIECYYLPFSIINIKPLYFEEPSLKGNKEIELIKNNIPQEILPYYEFEIIADWIYGSFRKRGRLNVCIWENVVRLIYYIRFGNTPKGYYTYTYNNIQEALPMIKELIGKMGYV